MESEIRARDEQDDRAEENQRARTRRQVSNCSVVLKGLGGMTKWLNLRKYLNQDRCVYFQGYMYAVQESVC